MRGSADGLKLQKKYSRLMDQLLKNKMQCIAWRILTQDQGTFILQVLLGTSKNKLKPLKGQIWLIE